jgi:hypothetical protein
MKPNEKSGPGYFRAKVRSLYTLRCSDPLHRGTGSGPVRSVRTPALLMSGRSYCPSLSLTLRLASTAAASAANL